MLSITELVEKIPLAKMDSQKQMISIPIQEYENCRNIMALQDKQSIIRDLQKLLLNKEEDLQRYKDKCELQESVLQRTQKALDKCIQSDQAHSSIPLKTTVNRQHRAVISLKKSEPKPTVTSNPSGEMEVVARAVGDESTKAGSTPTSSLPDQSTRLSFIEDSSNIKSLPPCLSVGSPGMSTALLKRLVQENLKLKSQLDRRQLPKASKSIEELEKIISDLKLKVAKKQQIIDDVLNQSGSKGQAASRLEALHKENSAYMDTIEMDKIVINALKQENAQYRKDRDEMENLLIQYRQHQSMTEETRDRVSEVERNLREEMDSRKVAESKVQSLQVEVDKLKEDLEKAESARELAVKNYNTLSSQFHKSSERHATPQPAFMNQAPQLAAPQLSPQPASLPPQGYGLAQSMYAETQRIHPRTQVVGRSTSPQLPIARKIPESPSAYGTPKTFTQPLQESATSRMSQSVYVTPTQIPQSPLPIERKTFKCPRCDTKFMVLQGYRDHIKICLKG